MHLETDYTEIWNDEITDDSSGIDKTDYTFPDEKLRHILEYCRLQSQKYKIEIDTVKRLKLIELYSVLKKFAFVHSGKVCLDIDEKKMVGQITYWGECITFISEEKEQTKKILDSFYNNMEVVFLEEEKGGIQICGKTKLYKEIEKDAQEQSEITRVNGKAEDN